MDKFELLCQELAKLDKVKGITPVDVLSLPNPLDNVLRKMIRQGPMTLTELADDVGLSPAEAQRLGEILIEKGFLQAEERRQDSDIVYKIYFARMRTHNIPLDL